MIVVTSWTCTKCALSINSMPGSVLATIYSTGGSVEDGIITSTPLIHCSGWFTSNYYQPPCGHVDNNLKNSILKVICKISNAVILDISTKAMENKGKNCLWLSYSSLAKFLCMGHNTTLITLLRLSRDFSFLYLGFFFWRPYPVVFPSNAQKATNFSFVSKCKMLRHPKCGCDW